VKAQLTPLSVRYAGLDGLRGIAALGVAIVHAYPTHTFWIGWSLVDLFFVLSGFLIGSMLLDERVNLRNFLIRRALRIWPLYYLTLALALVASYMRVSINPGLEAPSDVVASIFFVQGIAHYGLSQAELAVFADNYILWFGHSWSLAVEQQFYVLLPLLLVVFSPSRGAIALAACAAIAGTLMARSSGHFLGVLITRADGLLLGVVLAALFSVRETAAAFPERMMRVAWPVLAVVGLAMVVPYVLDGYAGRIPDGSWPTNPFVVLGYSLIYCALVGSVVMQPDSLLARALSTKALVYLGAISYAVYMFHPLIQGMIGMYERGVPIRELPLVLQGAMWALIIGCAHLSKVFFEEPFNALKSRFPLYRDAARGNVANASTHPAKEALHA